METLRRFRWGRPWVTNVVLCLLGYGLLMMARQFVAETDHFTIGFSGASGWSAWLYLASVLVVMTQPTDRKTVWIVLGFAVAMRGMTLFEAPFLSTDIYRYVWDGVVQHAGVNPYRYVPGDKALTFLRADNAEVFANINRRDYAPTIYPPVAQMIYWLATFFEPTVQGMKAAMFVFECGTAGALLWLLRAMQRPMAEVLLYAWCPLLVWEIAGAGHVDAAVYCFVVLALMMRWQEKPVWVGLFLGLAVMTKFYPLVLAPALWKRGDWKMPATLSAVVVCGYAVYASVGMKVFGFLGAYTQEEGMKDGTRYFALEVVRRVWAGAPQGLFLGFAAVVLGAVSWWCWKNCSHDRMNAMRGAMMLAMAMMLLFSPHYPWYIAWLIPMFCVVPEFAVLVYVCAFFYLFTTPLADGTESKMFVLNSILYGASAGGVCGGVVVEEGVVGVPE